MKVGGLREVMDGSEIVARGAFSFELLTSAAHLRQAVTQELAATSGKYGEEPAPVYEEDS